MKSILAGLLLLSLFAQGCDSHTRYGHCEGVFTEANKKSDLVYRASAWNIVMAFIFSETLIIPLYVIGWALECPEGTKASSI